MLHKCQVVGRLRGLGPGLADCGRGARLSHSLLVLGVR